MGPEQAEIDRKNYAPPTRIDSIMFPFLTKSKSSQPHLQRFSKDEIMRVLKYEMVELKKAKDKLGSQIRKKINEREKKKLFKLITKIKGEIKKRLLETLESTEPVKHGITLMKNRSL